MATTQVLLAQFQQHAFDEEEARREARSEAAAEEQLRYLAAFHKFEHLDGTFMAFLNTNEHRGRRFLFTELFSIRSPKPFRYTFMKIPYRATVFTYEDIDFDWLNIKLANDGFVYSPKEGRQVSRHMSQGWIALPRHKFVPYMTGMFTKLRELYKEWVAYYNFNLQRLDIKFYPAEDAAPGTPHLLVTYEPGYPDYEDRAEVLPLNE